MKRKRIHILTLVILLLAIFITSTLNAQSLTDSVNFSDHKFLPIYNLRKLGNTTIFQGNKKKSKYFEGWYFKMVSEDGKSILSVIPGISLSRDGEEQHAFIQIINGKTAETSYYSFPIESFSFSKSEFAVKIGENYFSADKVVLRLKDSTTQVSGEVTMHNRVPYTSGRMLNPGIMGWYRFVPFMQCYHGVVSLTHQLKGKLTMNEEEFNFEGGKGYIEKDYGSSMPSAWIWMQTNHFNSPNTSFMLSVANIPWLGNSFNGFLGFFYHNGELHRFATYRHTKLNLGISESDTVHIRLENKDYTFVIQAKTKNAGMLVAPVHGSMDRRIPESIDAILKISMLEKKGNVLYADSTNITGLEMVGDYKGLQGILK